MLIRLFVVAVLGVLAFVAPAFAEDAVPAVAEVVDPIVGLLLGLVGSGALGPWGVGAIVAISALRAGFATLSKHVTDEQLGRAGPIVNWFGGNTKHAANSGKTGKKKRGGVAATSLVLGVLALGAVWVACASTGDPARDAARRTLLVLACKSQCPIVYIVAIDACDGDTDGKVTPPDEPSTLYSVCVSEADLIRMGCPVLCDQIPLPTSPEENASEPT